MLPHLPISLLAPFAVFFLASGYRHTIPSIPATVPSKTQFESNKAFDGPHVSPVNLTTWDWWYFDAVSDDQAYQVVVVFYTASTPGFAFLPEVQNQLPVQITVGIPGSPSFTPDGFQNVWTYATQAEVSTVGRGASGQWEGTGISFKGKPDLSRYVIEVDAPNMGTKGGIKGRVTFESVAPAHYPCGPARAGETMEILPHIGWANAIPDAIAKVDLTLNGTPIKFTGVGYHDKNWGDRPFVQSTSSWYWGHGRLGPYSIVWFDALTHEGIESRSAYVSKNGRALVSGCQPGSITVRPTGHNAIYPPHAMADPPEGFYIEIDLGNGKKLAVNVTTTFLLLNGTGMYYRWSGSLKGGVVGEGVLHGTALFEQFALIP